MVFRIDRIVPDAPVAADAGNVTYASDDRAESVIEPASLHVAAFPMSDDPWHRKLLVEVRYLDEVSRKRDVPPLLLLLDQESAASLIEALVETYGVMAPTDRKVN